MRQVPRLVLIGLAAEDVVAREWFCARCTPGRDPSRFSLSNRRSAPLGSRRGLPGCTMQTAKTVGCSMRYGAERADTQPLVYTVHEDPRALSVGKDLDAMCSGYERVAVGRYLKGDHHRRQRP